MSKLIYDETKDKKVWECSEKINNNCELYVAVYQYEGQEPKLQIARKVINFTKDKPIFIKGTGRLDLQQLGVLELMISKAKKQMRGENNV